MDITQEEMTAWGLTPKEIYAASTEPAIVARPEVVIWWISALVMCGTSGRTSIADSPCPMKGDATANDGFCTGSLHGPGEEDSEFTDEPLQDIVVVQDLCDRHEKDDSRDNTHK